MRSWMDSAILVLPLVISIICLLITFTLEASEMICLDGWFLISTF